MDLGPNVLAHAWSFSNPNASIPYLISRTGLLKKNGGTGYKWSCTCPSFVNRGKKNCKHLSSFKESLSQNKLKEDSRFSLSDFGKEILNIK